MNLGHWLFVLAFRPDAVAVAAWAALCELYSMHRIMAATIWRVAVVKFYVVLNERLGG